MVDKERLNEAKREFEKACDEHIKHNGRNARVYISGPMSNLSREQYMELFRRAEQSLRAQGYRKIVNPISVWACRWPWVYRMMERVLGYDTAYYSTLLYDLWLLRRCDLIYKLPGWRDSRGANIESCVAYHFKIWPVPKDDINKLDKKLAKLMEKWNKKPN